MKKMKHSEHLVLKSRLPILRLKHNKALVSHLLFKTSARFKIKIYHNSLNSNHIHLLVKADSPKDLNDIVRVFAGQVAQRITGAVRGRKNRISFWIKPVWKRLVHWGRDFLNLQNYIFRNQLEALGRIPYLPRRPVPRVI